MDEKFDIKDQHFDCIVLGTELSESIIGSSLANHGKKVLHIEFDRGYSGSLKSLNIKELKFFYGKN